MAEIQTRQPVPHSWAGPSRLHSKRIGAFPLSSWGIGGAEDAWTMPQTSANALQRNRSMLTLINGASRDASRSTSVEDRSVSLSSPVSFRGGGDSGLVRKAAEASYLAADGMASRVGRTILRGVQR